MEQSDLLMDDVLSGFKAAMVPVMGKPAALVDPAACRAAETLQMRGAELKQGFAAQLRRHVFGGASTASAAPQTMRFDDFQFLDANQLDANIEAAHCQQLVATAVEEVLPKFNALMSNLLGWSSVQGHINPLRPENFSNALRAAIEEWVPDRHARSIVTGIAAGSLGESLGHLYRELIEWLRAQGVEAVHMTPAKTTGIWNPAKVPDSTVARTMLTLDKLRRLLSGELDPNPSSGDRIDFASTIPASLEALQDMRLVEPMMRRLSERASKASLGAPPETAKVETPDMLAEQAEQDHRKKLGEQLGREVVLLMLENLMKDRRLLAPVRESLRALEPVLLKLAQHDGRFFSERHHPARVFLDRMTHRSLGFASEDASGYDVFQQTFDNAVRALSSGAGDAAAFGRILVKLDEGWAREEEGQQQRAAEAARGLLRAEQRNMLARLHSKLLAERLVGIQVPSKVASFLCGPWAQVVAQAQLQLADGSEDPGGYIALVDDLLWSVQKHLICNNRARLVEMMPELLLGLRKGLTLISYPQKRMVSFFDSLITHQEKLFDDADAEESVQATQHSEQDSFWVGEREAADSGYVHANDLDLIAAGVPLNEESDRRVWRVESLASGAWVDLKLDGEWLRVQLTWASPQRTLFMFISSKGNAHSMTRNTLEKMKVAGRVRLVSDSRLIDKALDAVAQMALDNDLRKRTKAPE